MIAVENHTVKYFRPPEGDFWFWSDNGTVIAWTFGNTICYRDDLIALLRQVNSGMPPLSPLLLLIAACKEKLPETSIRFFMRKLSDFNGAAQNSKLHKTLKYALTFLDTVSLLPENLRTGQKRIHLIYEVFSGASFTFNNRQLQDAIDELNSGRIDNDVFNLSSEKITEEDFTNCLLYFCTALQKYPTLQSLTVKLRTGLDEIPTAVPGLLPETESGNLYDQLLQDPETAGIARLAKRLTAAVNIPMQSKGSSDQPFGGISDITNRGNYDKLLLSELAHDDELLMARLVNKSRLKILKWNVLFYWILH
jgi:MoxR-vWA-beta-propeller ternary system domain bpX0